jgi:tetratricopeptide (TPR) repeat protein
MIRRLSYWAVTAAAGLAPHTAAAQSPPLGRIEFPTSGRAEAQSSFVRGVLHLHSFAYDSAARHFRDAQRLDPDYAMAYWGEAMTYSHPLWFQEDLGAGRAVLQRLAPTPAERRLRAPTARERRWIETLEVLYGDGPRARRDTLYAREMSRFARDYPGDHEVAVFHALSLLCLSRTGRDVPTYMRAAAIVEDVLSLNPEHPGALHVAIHAYDDPEHAPLGLRAARRYGELAPAAHAQHLTSHIFLASGMWDDVERANQAAWERSGRRNGHYAHWLAYALAQKGHFAEARSLVKAVLQDAVADATPEKLGSMNLMMAGYLVDAEAWATPWALQAIDSLRRVDGVRVEASALDFAAALGAIRRGETATARRLRQTIASRHDRAHSSPAPRAMAGLASAQVMGALLDGLLLAAEGLRDSALTLVREAARGEVSIPHETGPPAVVKPAHEVLGELLLDAGRVDEALDAFELVLRRAPNRSRAVLGAARAAAGRNDAVRGADYYARFLANCAGTDERNLEMAEAEGYLAKVGKR